MVQSVWLRQCGILLRKNYRIALRNRQATLIQIFVPLFFVLLIFLLQFALQENQALTNLINVIRDPEQKTVGAIPKCILGKGIQRCITVAYTPSNDAFVQQLMERLRIDNNLQPDDLLAFGFPGEFNTYATNNPNTTQGAYHFRVQRNSLNEVIGLRYAIQYNQTETATRGIVNNPRIEVFLPMQKAIETAFLKVQTNDSALTLDVSYSDYAHPEITPINVVATVGPVFFFGALMFNVVIQIGQIVNEKENRLRTSMSMMGLKTSVYWVTWFITFFVINTISVLVLIISGLIFQFDFFLLNAFGLYFFLFFFFALSMVALVFFLSIFIGQSKTATLVGFGIFLLGVIIQSLGGLIYDPDVNIGYRVLFSLIPVSLLSRGMSDLGQYSQRESDTGLAWSRRSSYTNFFPITDQYAWLVLDFFIYLILAIYLDQVVPDLDGRRQSYFFFLRKSYWFPPLPERTQKRQPAVELKDQDPTPKAKSDNDDDAQLVEEQIVKREMQKAIDGKDEDVIAEQKKANNGEDYPVQILDIKKTFFATKYGCVADHAHDFNAVRGVTLFIEKDTLFCLLGHNGAGKTTLFGMLTGLLSVTDGDAVILGHSIKDGLPQIQPSMGVCPQYDILWEQLSAAEHLEMFAGFKNIPVEQVTKEVEDRLQDVDLFKFRDRLAGSYSGGMKRRLSVAISLIGNPQIVYLDEPTTGMDPVSRRQVWDLIEKVKRNRVTILTTHSMEEADVLGDRIGIMKQGRFICLGSSLRLKNKFGTGYRVTVVAPEDQYDAITKFIRDDIPRTLVIGKDESAIRFGIPRNVSHALPDFFEKLEDNKKRFGITDLQLSMTSLEEVFLALGAMGEDERVGNEDKDETFVGRFKSWPIWKKIVFVLGLLLVAMFLIGIIGAATRSSSSATLATAPYSASLSALPAAEWAEIQPGGATMCSRGQPYSFFVRKGSETNKVALYFEGGGFCSDARSCDQSLSSTRFNGTVYLAKESIKANNFSGIFDASNPDNPARNWVHVYVSYCTADMHWGNISQIYDAGLTLQHFGAANVRAVLNWVYKNLPAAEQVGIFGTGEGGWGASLWTHDVLTRYPNARVALFVDSAVSLRVGTGASNTSELMAQSTNTWRVDAVRQWNSAGVDVVTSLVAAQNGSANATTLLELNALTESAGVANANASFSRFSFKNDRQIVGFYLNTLLISTDPAAATFIGLLSSQSNNSGFIDILSIAGVSALPPEALEAIYAVLCPARNAEDARTKAALASNFASFVAEGTDTSFLTRRSLYTAKNGDRAFIDWFKTYFAGNTVPSSVPIAC